MDILDFYKLTQEKHILLSFKGALSQEILSEMGNLIKSRLSLNKKIKKIFSVFIELSQNIMHYSAEKEYIDDKEIGVGILLFLESDNTYNIISGNLMDNKKVEKLKTHIDKLKSMSQSELKESYNDQIRQLRNSESKGAGLGFIDICRKSDGNINYEFFQIDDTNTFFSFIAKISKEGTNE